MQGMSELTWVNVGNDLEEELVLREGLTLNKQGSYTNQLLKGRFCFCGYEYDKESVFKASSFPELLLR